MFLKRFYQFFATEYWRARALEAEACLEAETWRNRTREDELATLYVRGMGMFGLPPRTGPAGRGASVPQLARTASPFDALGAVDRMEFETNWLPDAVANNVPVEQARQRFLMEIAKRKTINDDFQM
jgi:hypothetical protein